MKYKLLLLFVAMATVQLNAQCSFDPVIEGDIIFCPNQTAGELSTNQPNADSYQWLSRPFSGGTITPIPGATNSTLSITNADILTYFYVDVTINGCTERSPEVLIDQWLFLLPTVETTGDYVFDGSAFLICEGDSMFMTLMPPYDTNITWFRDGTPIPGETDTTLEVTEPGAYTVIGAPAICPDYLQPLGLELLVLYNTDPNTCDILGVNNVQTVDDVVVYPNPASDLINIVSQETISSVVVQNILGQQLHNSEPGTMETTVDLSGFSKGTYFVSLRVGEGTITKKVVKK